MPGLPAPPTTDERVGLGRIRVHTTVLADVEQQVMALRALHAKLREMADGENFGCVVARSRPVGPLETVGV